MTQIAIKPEEAQVMDQKESSAWLPAIELQCLACLLQALLKPMSKHPCDDCMLPHDASFVGSARGLSKDNSPQVRPRKTCSRIFVERFRSEMRAPNYFFCWREGFTGFTADSLWGTFHLIGTWLGRWDYNSSAGHNSDIARQA